MTDVIDAAYPEDFYDEDEYDDPYDDDPCNRCGPWCEHWAGDGLCMLVIEQHAQEGERFEEKYVRQDVECPHCQVNLTQYQIPTDRLWVWPGEWPGGEYYNPMIALGIFSVMNAPKGEVHPPVTGRFYVFHHIWVGVGEFRRESLIMLNKPEEHTHVPV